MELKPSAEELRQHWWQSRRLEYNKGLIIAGILAFFLYAVLGSWLIAPHDKEFEITLFTTFFQGVGYLVMMAIANICYGLGLFVDTHYNNSNDPIFRQRLFNLGYWFSFALPFSIPTLVVIIHLTN